MNMRLECKIVAAVFLVSSSPPPYCWASLAAGESHKPRENNKDTTSSSSDGLHHVPSTLKPPATEEPRPRIQSQGEDFPQQHQQLVYRTERVTVTGSNEDDRADLHNANAAGDDETVSFHAELWTAMVKKALEHEELEKVDETHLKEVLQGAPEYDDRTLLDVFGEAAKEYLTQRVIPETDPTCRWDWRSLRCEPSCECTFRFQGGDYHLGRSCRRRLEEAVGCIPVDPARLFRDQPATKRILSLVAQTSQILRDKLQRMMRSLLRKPVERFTRFQNHLCQDLWTMHRQDLCWPQNEQPEKSISERIFCGPIEFRVCDGEGDVETSNHWIGA